jgi:GNAT superfamily N-acetyltransferase
MMILIRPAYDQDVEGLSSLSNQLGYPCPAETLKVFLNDLKQDPEHAVFIAENEDQLLIGFIHVFKTRRLFLAPFAELGGVVVRDRFRESGVGKFLLREAECWAADQNCQQMRVRSNIIREQARGFYLRAGYQEIKQQRIFRKHLQG